jgi:hypothetical protein
MFVSPGFPDPLPPDITTIGDPAVASPKSDKRIITNGRDEISFFFIRITLNS